MIKISMDFYMHTKRAKGFTLIELLIVITIVTTLAVVVFVAVNPVQRLKEARDTRRRTDVDNFLTAVLQYVNDNKGQFPSGVTTGMAETQIGTGLSGCNLTNASCSIIPTSCVDFTSSLVKYLKTIPQDPKTGSASQTQYTISVDTNNIVTIKACGTEGATVIQES